MDLLATKAHIHDDPREKEVAATYDRRAKRFVALLNSGYRVLFLYTLRLADGRPCFLLRFMAVVVVLLLRWHGQGHILQYCRFIRTSSSFHLHH